MFLIAERSFVVGDLLDVNGRLGFVISIDLLSVKLRTFDNLMMRVPNEEMIKTTVLNLTRFPIRRLDLQGSSSTSRIGTRSASKSHYRCSSTKATETRLSSCSSRCGRNGKTSCC
jgi:hypothetical protein